jgi:hypothetical protein
MPHTFALGLLLGWIALRRWNIPHTSCGWTLFTKRLVFLVVSLALVSIMEQGLNEVTVFAAFVLLAKSAVSFLFLFGPQIGEHS